MGARARGKYRYRYRRLGRLGRDSARVIIDSFNIELEVFVYNSRNFSVKLCEWLIEIGGEFADLI